MWRSTTTLFLFLNAITLVSAASSPASFDQPFQSKFKLDTLCVSLFHRNGRIGCGTYSHDTMTGTLLHWSTLTSNVDYYSSLESVLPSFVAVIDEHEFTSEVVSQLTSMNANNKLLGGILVFNSTITSSESAYSNPAPVSPRGQNTPSYKLNPNYDYEWNPNGDGLILEDLYGVPTAYVNDIEMGTQMLQAAKDQSNLLLSVSDSSGQSESRSKSSGLFSDSSSNIPPVLAEFDLYMGPETVTTEKCLSWIENDDVWRPKCLPLGGNSVWAKAGSPSTASDDGGDDNDGGDNDGESIILVATNLDSSSMFHDVVPGANTAASNILTLLMAAKLLGASIDDDTLNSFDKKIVFAFFQGEQYGFMGSRSFLKDVAYPGFECDEGRTVPTIAKKKDEDGYSKTSCLNPMRHDLDFMNLGTIAGMIAVDQVGILSDENTFYVHDNGNGDGLSDILLQMTSDDWSVNEGSAGAVPPTPLSSLVQLSEGNVGGAVLSGYDDTFTNDAYYLSHLDSNNTAQISLESIAKAATFVARAALASVYDGNDGDYENSVQYAEGLIEELDSSDETLIDLSNCLFIDGNCETLKAYTKIENMNNRDETGFDVGIGQDLGTPPNYYVSIFDRRNGQTYAQIGRGVYGSYTGDEEYGKANTDAVLIQPNFLEMSVHGLLNDFLGRGTNGDDDLTSCQSLKDCSDVSYCSYSGDSAVCTGSNVCVCSRSHYHYALDEAIVPAPNNYTGMFLISSDDEGISPAYSEPYWDSNIGVHVYRDGGENGAWALGAGIVLAGAWIAFTIYTKRALRKEKLY